MAKGWRLVARLGGSKARYPHILVDAHGWCLRWGPVPRDDDKFYSRFETVLEGLVEHCIRRRLLQLGSVLEPQGLLEEVRDVFQAARDLAATAVLSVGPGKSGWQDEKSPLARKAPESSLAS